MTVVAAYTMTPERMMMLRPTTSASLFRRWFVFMFEVLFFASEELVLRTEYADVRDGCFGCEHLVLSSICPPEVLSYNVEYL
jgi:hypothetical protein